MERLSAQVVRRAIDIGISALALIALSPLMIIIAIMVILTSPGPALFRQERVGLRGRTFMLLKFRSMRASVGGPEVTSGSDSRITAVGQLLRRTKLDELPQFANVLRGEMALVGPRPEVPRYVAHYDAAQRAVLDVRPGITGLSQVEFRHEEELLAGREDVENYYIREIMPLKLAMDLNYVHSRTVAGDISILFRTIAALFTRN